MDMTVSVDDEMARFIEGQMASGRFDHQAIWCAKHCA